MTNPTFSVERMAFDRGSVRTYDADGRLHVSVTNLSREEVCEYLGMEIPNWQALGLDPQKQFSLYRPGDEIAKAAKTFRNMPLLSEHKPVSADDHKPDLVVGAVGTDVEYVAPFLRGSLVIWAADAVEKVENGEAKEISCGYYYTPVLEDGVFNGKRYSIRMTELIANHVAIVPIGRATGVVIGDSQPTELIHMSKKAPTRMAVLARGALMAVLKPKLATDSKLDLTSLLSGITAANWTERKSKIADAIKPKLANDADMSDIVALLDSLDGDGVETANDEDDGADPMAAQDADEDDDEETKAAKKKKAEELAAKAAQAQDDDEPPAVKPKKDEDKMDKPAMDAAIAAAMDKTRKETLKLARDIVAAEKAVHPYVGELVAQDSAEGVYKAALDVLKVDVTGVHPSAYRHILAAQPKPGSEVRTVAATVAMDSAAKDTFHKQFPGLAHIKLG